jgi:hypothetical protein
MHPGSLFLGFSLLVFSCLSNNIASLTTAALLFYFEDGAPLHFKLDMKMAAETASKVDL